MDFSKTTSFPFGETADKHIFWVLSLLIFWEPDNLSEYFAVTEDERICFDNVLSLSWEPENLPEYSTILEPHYVLLVLLILGICFY